MSPRRKQYGEGDTLRCFCAAHPILGIVKRDNFDKPFVHIKIYKQNSIYGEILFKMGEIRVRCRSCYRWHTIKIVREKAVIEEVPDEPDIVDLVPDPFP
jgi:hypothetical protein